jgi:hypothetical protein
MHHAVADGDVHPEKSLPLKSSMALVGVTAAGGSAAKRLGTEANASTTDATPASPIRIKFFMDKMFGPRGRFVKMEAE